ncbi:TfoX/Sxy family protein, partial [Tropicimonas sp.]|uniref:TfoX/Sxy family protein n=1 Tax=Tropicimonas sp. TaxID=2067044 RepID=UPI003A885530
MAISEQMAETLRSDLGFEPGLSEKRMFGALCFLIHGNMVAGLDSSGAFYRPGKAGLERALALPGVTRMMNGARPMGGFVRLDDDGFDDDLTRETLTEMSFA